MKIKFIIMNKNVDPFHGMEINDVQNNYFEGILVDPNENDHKYYLAGNHGVNVESGDLLLFQYDNHIISKAILSFKALDKTYLKLSQNSVKTFKPIDKNELKKYISSFKHFSNTPQEFDEEIVDMESLLKRFDVEK